MNYFLGKTYLTDISNQRLIPKPSEDTFMISQSPEFLNSQLVSSDQSENNPLLCLISIEVQRGILDDIKIYYDSDPVNLAYHFCKRNKITEQTMFKLMKHINESKQQAIEKLHKFTRQNDPYTLGNYKQNPELQFPQEYMSPIFEHNQNFDSDDQFDDKYNTLLTDNQQTRISEPIIQIVTSPQPIFQRYEYHQNDEQMTFTPRINTASEQIFQDKFNNGKNVFDRLYSHGKVQKQLQFKMSQNKNSAKLFQESDKSDKQLTPRQNSRSDEIIEPYENRLNRYAQDKQNNIQVLRQQLEEGQQNKCSFQPKINNKSQEILKKHQNESRSPARHTQERFDKRQSVVTLDNNQSMCFQPRINKKSIDQVRGSTFEDRQTRFLLDKEQKLHQLIEIQDARDHCDFKPQIIKKQESYLEKTKQSQRDPVWLSLYQENLRRQLVQESKQAAISQMMKEQRPKVNDYSEKLLKERAQKMISMIFQQLDDNDDGYISLDKINLKGVSPIILQIIQSILYEMEERNEKLSQEQFTHMILNNRDQYLWKRLVDNKSYLLQ